MKKLLTSLCAFALALVCLLVLPTHAEAATEGDYTYTVANGEATITGYTGTGGDITIPSELGDYPVTAIGDKAFYENTKITSVVIPDSVVTIGNYAFVGKEYIEDGWMVYYRSNLISVTIGNGVKYIGEGAFLYCMELESIVIPDSVISIGRGAFWGDSNSGHGLSEVTIGKGVAEIGQNAFLDQDNITDVYYNASPIHWNAIKIQSGNDPLTKAKIHYAEDVNIITQPQNGYAPLGQRATISLEATGEGLKYQWYYALKGVAKWSRASSTTNTFVSGKMSATLNGCRLMCIVTDKYGNTAKSNVVTLNLANFAKIVTQPKHGVAPAGQRATVTIKATGDGLKYQWYYALRGATKWAVASSKTDTFITGKLSAGLHGCRMMCIVTDKYGNSVKSNVVVLYMGNTAKIVTQPKNAVAPKGLRGVVTLKATGDGLKYQWYYALRGATKWSAASSKTNTFITGKMSATLHGCRVMCIVTDKYGNTARSDVVTLYMGNPAKIVTQPKSVAVAYGLTGKAIVKATGDGLTYTWYFAPKGATKWSVATSKTNVFALRMSSVWNGCRAFCIVTDKYGNAVRSNIVTFVMR